MITGIVNEVLDGFIHAEQLGADVYMYGNVVDASEGMTHWFPMAAEIKISSDVYYYGARASRGDFVFFRSAGELQVGRVRFFAQAEPVPGYVFVVDDAQIAAGVSTRQPFVHLTPGRGRMSMVELASMVGAAIWSDSVRTGTLVVLAPSRALA